MWSATPAPGTSTTRTISASRCAFRFADVDFVTIHHELGHNFYQRAYKDQPFLFQNGANDGFHEAIGDAIALSITPEYLQKIGLLDKVPDATTTFRLLLKQALDKVAFLPFGLLIDQWRWKVFSGEIKPENYNKAWWDLRLKYQGIAPPVARSEADFDPGREVSRRRPMFPTRAISWPTFCEFQFYRALCRESGYKGPLNRCSILRIERSRRKIQQDAGDGPEQALARRAGSADRPARRWTPARSWNISRRLRSGWTSRTRGRRWVGRNALSPNPVILSAARGSRFAILARS